ncbi:MAG: alanine dehydrogenase [Bacteroidia bacterium]
MKIGLIREWKQPADKRVALTPALCEVFKERFPDVELVIEASIDRTFTDSEYEWIGVAVQHDMSDCDILLGIKEVPIENLIPNKTYLFFSHTIKAQEYNRNLLQNILANKIRLIDYEPLVWPEGGRILGFGKWAGIVGAYNAFLTLGEKQKSNNLPPAHTTSGYEECMELLKSVETQSVRIAFTGNGRVANGIREVLESMQLKEVSPEEFLHRTFNETVFVQLKNEDLYERIDGEDWNDSHFYNNHSEYKSLFGAYLTKTDMLINGMYWEDDMPALFTKEDTSKQDFALQVIADITCDVEGSVPITMEATDIYNPTFGWSKSQQCQVEKYGDDTIDIMAITNLPTEMPKNASQEFGHLLLDHIIPLLINDPQNEILDKASITTFNGNLNSHFEYLRDYVEGK